MTRASRGVPPAPAPSPTLAGNTLIPRYDSPWALPVTIDAYPSVGADGQGVCTPMALAGLLGHASLLAGGDGPVGEVHGDQLDGGGLATYFRSLSTTAHF